MRAFTISSLLTITMVALSPGGAAAQGGGADVDEISDAMKIAPYFLLGMGGEADVEQGPFSGEVDLDPTVGFGFRFEIPVWDYIVVGPLFQYNAFQQDVPNTDRDHLFDIDAFVKGRYVLAAGDMPLELYAMLPVGFTAAALDGDGTDAGIGWNLGLMFGAMLFVTDSIGIMYELGFFHHSIDADTDLGGEVEADANQARMHFGAAFAF